MIHQSVEILMEILIRRQTFTIVTSSITYVLDAMSLSWAWPLSRFFLVWSWVVMSWPKTVHGAYISTIIERLLTLFPWNRWMRLFIDISIDTRLWLRVIHVVSRLLPTLEVVDVHIKHNLVIFQLVHIHMLG